MPRLRSLVLLLLALLPACAPAAPACPAPPAATLGTTIDIGPGELDAYGSRRDAVALCLRAATPRLVLVALPAGPVAELPWPLDDDARCDRVALGEDVVCLAGYEAGVGCVARDGSGQPRRPAISSPPTGLAWDDRGLWIATDGAGLWWWSPTGATEQAVPLPDLMSGLVAGPFGLVWGTGGEYTWRTHLLRRDREEPEWLRPPLPPNVACEHEPEVCEWVSSAVGTYRGLVWFTAENAPAPLYAWHPQDGTWHEFQTVGEVHVGPSGVFAVREDGSLATYSAREERFVELTTRLAPGGAPVAAPGGLWVAADGRLRLVVPSDAHAAERAGAAVAVTRRSCGGAGGPGS